MLMLLRPDEEWEGLTDAERDYAAIDRWWAQLAQSGRLRGGHELRPARTATTVDFRGGRTVVSDGPFVEAKETIGGYGIVDVPDRAAAIEIAKTWPARGHAVEVRPVIER